MRPAPHVVSSTILTGAGYGLVAILGLLTPAGFLPADPVAGAVAFGVALAAVLAGLAASTFRLGAPSQAWRAYSQWRTSWLAREAAASLATLVPAAVFAVGWIAFSRVDGPWALAGFAAALLAVYTVYCTAKVYGSRKPIAAWHQPLTVPVYLAFAAMSGALLMNLVSVLLGFYWPWAVALASAAVVYAWGLKIMYWRRLDARQAKDAARRRAAAGEGGRTEGAVPRGRRRLRRIALLAALVALLALVVQPAAPPGAPALLAALASVAAGGLAVAVERWLFFADAGAGGSDA